MAKVTKGAPFKGSFKCEVCGCTFTEQTSNRQKYCSKKCRQQKSNELRRLRVALCKKDPECHEHILSLKRASEARCKANPDCVSRKKERGKQYLPIANLRRNARRYGIAKETAELFYGSNCEVCKRTSKEVSQLQIDHDHVSGAVRGVLCNRCNTRLWTTGKDDAEILRKSAKKHKELAALDVKLAQYLEKHSD